MRAVTWHGRRDVRVETAPDPAIQAPTDAIIRVTFNISCGHCFMCDQGLHSQDPAAAMTRRAGGAARLAAIAAAGALALAGCGGGETAQAPPGPAAPAARPTLAASQEVVDLVNRYSSDFAGAAGSDLGVAEVQQRAARLHEGADAVTARVEALVAHPCVERLARGQASLMRTLSDFLEAAADGRTEDAAGLSQELRQTDQAAILRQGAACQARVGFRGPEGT